MLLVGVGFKLAVVPFHMWTPDVYQGAPAPVGAYVATVSKGAVFALLLRYLPPRERRPGSTLFLVLAAVAIASMLAGNLLALRQDNVKRILAYSSIAHLGYLLVAFLASGRARRRRPSASTWSPTSRPRWSPSASSPCSRRAERDADPLADYRGLGARRPWLAAVFAVALFSLAGMPLTMGFIGKFTIVTAGAGLGAVGAGHRPRAQQHHRPVLLHAPHRGDVRAAAEGRPRRPARRAGEPRGVVVLAALTAFLLVFGVYPAPLLRLVEHAVSTLPWP